MCLPCFDNLRRSPRSDSPRHTQSHNMGIDLVILVISRWGERAGRGNSVILCSHGRLAQRLAQVLYTHKAGGSNPSSPTKECEREGRVALAFLFSVRGFFQRAWIRTPFGVAELADSSPVWGPRGRGNINLEFYRGRAEELGLLTSR